MLSFNYPGFLLQLHQIYVAKNKQEKEEKQTMSSNVMT